MDTYEKKYKEALERAKDFIEKQNPPAFDADLIGTIFPELQESEDEKVKKAAIAFVEASDHFGYHLGISKENVLDWLEKQGEKLPAGFYYVNSEGKKFYSDTFKYGDVILHVEKQSEKKPTDNDMVEALRTEYEKGRADAIAEMQKPTWSEEEVRINRIVACLENLNVADNDILLKDVDWLKSLKQRIGE